MENKMPLLGKIKCRNLWKILYHLQLPKKTKISGKNGYDKLKNLYKRANKIYYKGMKSNGMIDKLNIYKIVVAVKEQLKPLYEILGVDLI